MTEPKTVDKPRAKCGIDFRFLLVQKEVGYGAKPHFDPCGAHFFSMNHLSFEKSEASFQTNTTFSTDLGSVKMTEPFVYSTPYTFRAISTVSFASRA